MHIGNLKYALIVGAAGAIYGLTGSLAKSAYADGWTWQQVSFAQAFLATMLFALACVLLLATRRRLKRVGARHVAQMMGLGVIGSTTTLLYMFALSRLPVAAALTMLFQFVWMGIALQLVLERRGPRLFEAAAAALALVGTVLTTGLLQVDLIALDPLGLVAGFGAGIGYTLYLHFNGRVGVGVPQVQRGFFVCMGAMLLTFLSSPDFFMHNHVRATLLKDGLPIALSAQVLPVLLLGISTPHLPTGITSVMASSELPSGILFSVAALGEIPTPMQIAGMCLVLAAIVVSQIPALRKRE